LSNFDKGVSKVWASLKNIVYEKKPRTSSVYFCIGRKILKERRIEKSTDERKTETMKTAPMIYVMFLMRADPLCGQVGGGCALEIETFWALEMASSRFNGFARIKTLRTGTYEA
jgi:hypothetical protein